MKTIQELTEMLTNHNIPHSEILEVAAKIHKLCTAAYREGHKVGFDNRAKPVNNKVTTFNVWHDGDRSVGIWGDSATVVLEVYDDEYKQAVKDILKEAFTNLWDFKAHVATDQELEEEP